MPKTFVVTHTCLILPRGNAMNGTVLSEDELTSVDVERLLDLGAIAVASDSDASGEQRKTVEVEEPEEIEEVDAVEEVVETEEAVVEETEVQAEAEADVEQAEQIEDAVEVEQPEPEEAEVVYDTVEVAGIEVKTPPLSRMNRAQLLGVMADLGISPENEDKMNRVEMIEAIKQAQTEAAE